MAAPLLLLAGILFRPQKKPIPRNDPVLPPGSLGLPYMGETLQFLLECSTGEFFTKRIAKYGPIFKTHILGSPTVMIVGPENVKKILLGEHVLVSSIWPPSFTAVLGQGTLSMMDAVNHKVFRKVVLKAFHSDRLSPLVHVIHSIVQQQIQHWAGHTVLVYDTLKEITFKSACCAFLGLDPQDSTLQELSQDFAELTRGLFTVPLNLPGTGFYAALKARKRIHDVISSKMASGTGLRSWGLLHAIHSLSVEGNMDLDPDSITSMALELMLGGQETSASALTSAILVLSRNKEVVSRLREEMAEHDLMDTEDGASIATLESMQYLNNVMKEVLRLFPPIGGGYRKVLKTFTVNGYTVPAGWNVTYSIKFTHDTASIFQDDPEAFNPDRWNNLKDDCVVNCNYVPFGAGPRACVGKQYGRLFFRLFLLELVRQYDWDVLDENPSMHSVPILKPADGLPASFRKRQSHTKL